MTNDSVKKGNTFQPAGRWVKFGDGVRVMNDEVWDRFKYPVTFQGREDGSDEWQTFFTADSARDVKWRLRNHGYRGDYAVVRFITADGQEFRHTAAEIERRSRAIVQATQKQLAPLRRFISSAPDDALQTASEIIKSAEMSQHFTIARNSAVIIDKPSLHRLEFNEFDDAVVCKIYHAPHQTMSETAVTIWRSMNPEVKAAMIEQGIDENAPPFAFSPDEINDGIKSFLVLLCASIVRDFWVLNERSRREKYIPHTQKHRQREGKGKNRKLTITKTYTFIPRFRYNLDVYKDKPKTQVKHSVRVNLSPAFVSGHIRRLPEGYNPSEEAIGHAKEFGITRMEAGTTFVRPHERGEIDQLRAYRSHSAMQMLFEQEN